MCVCDMLQFCPVLSVLFDPFLFLLFLQNVFTFFEFIQNLFQIWTHFPLYLKMPFFWSDHGYISGGWMWNIFFFTIAIWFIILLAIYAIVISCNSSSSSSSSKQQHQVGAVATPKKPTISILYTNQLTLWGSCKFSQICSNQESAC